MGKSQSQDFSQKSAAQTKTPQARLHKDRTFQIVQVNWWKHRISSRPQHAWLHPPGGFSTFSYCKLLTTFFNRILHNYCAIIIDHFRILTAGLDLAYTWVERGTVRVKCLAQEHNPMSPARTRTRTTRSGVERTSLFNKIVNMTSLSWLLRLMMR